MAFKWLARLTSVKKICFVSQELIHYFQKRGFNFSQDKVKLLYNNATIQPSFENKSKSNKIVIGYIGRLVCLKRVEYLIELAQFLICNKFVDFHLQIVGDGDQRNLLEQEVLEKELQAFVSFVGFQKNVEKYYTGFDLFVNPSKEECLSIALIDAGMYGIPSIAFDVGGNNEIIINSQTGYIVNTKEEFFERVFSLLDDKNLREDMSKKATEHCLIHFSTEVHLQKLENLYKEVLS
jgi:glycosyltransferase involved in cell wall biosynthesis